MSSRTTSGRNSAAASTASCAVVGRADVVAHDPQHHRQAVGAVPVVVHDQDAERRLRGRRLVLLGGRLRPGRLHDDRQADDELAPPCPAPRCGPRRCRRASRPAASPASGRCPARPATVSSDRSTCENISKTRGSWSAAMPMPVSSHRHHHLAPLPLGGQPDVTAPLGVLGGVVQQVARTPGPAGSGRRPR